MPARDLPARPNLGQYKKRAKELRDAYRSGDADAAHRVRQHMRAVDASDTRKVKALALTDAQFVIAREHGFDSWPKFARHIETLTIAREVEALADPIAAFFEAAGPSRSGIPPVRSSVPRRSVRVIPRSREAAFTPQR